MHYGLCFLKLFEMNNVKESIISIKTLCKLEVVYIWGLENIIGYINNNIKIFIKLYCNNNCTRASAAI